MQNYVCSWVIFRNVTLHGIAFGVAIDETRQLQYIPRYI